MTKQQYAAAVLKIHDAIEAIEDKDVQTVFNAVQNMWCDNEADIYDVLKINQN